MNTSPRFLKMNPNQVCWGSYNSGEYQGVYVTLKYSTKYKSYVYSAPTLKIEGCLSENELVSRINSKVSR